MLFVYVFSVLSVALPLQLSNPAWIQALINALIQNAIIPLAAIVFIVLLVILVPCERPTCLLARFISRSALPVALGFFMLIPLQSGLAIYVIGQSNQEEARDLAEITNRFAASRDRIASASEPSELSAAASMLPRDVIQTLSVLPLSQARSRTQEALDQLQRSIIINRSGQQRQFRWQIAKESARNLFSALLIGIAFFTARFRKIGKFLYGPSTSGSAPLTASRPLRSSHH